MSKIYRYSSDDFTVRIAAVDATAVIQELQAVQKMFPIPVLGVGQAMVGAILLASQLKEKQQVGLLFRGNGSIKSIYAEANYEGHVRAYTPSPQYEPADYKDGFKFKNALGHGTLSVARHQPFQKQPFHGTVELVSEDIAENIAHYLHQSHQIRSVVALGLYLDEYGIVKKAGGVILEIMPGVDETIVDRIEANVKKNQPSISNILNEGGSVEDLVKPYMEGITFSELEHNQTVTYFCPCTKDRVSAALEVLGEADLQDMIEKEEQPEIICQMCGKPYHFMLDEIKEIRERLQKNSMH
ncbi:MAG: Hsp33 family molecular chaperone HslO [Bdellovibrionaceae bacterium]|nr:Hsp33 family molecular chaperone HslO [Pseudobdellovibrionaceae bacterium]